MIKEQHKCPVCHAVFETGDYIADDSESPITEWSQCHDCEEMISMGFVVLVEAREDRSDEEVPSTGNYYFLPDEFFQHIFEMKIPEEALGMVFVDASEYSGLCEKHKHNLH